MVSEQEYFTNLGRGDLYKQATTVPVRAEGRTLYRDGLKMGVREDRDYAAALQAQRDAAGSDQYKLLQQGYKAEQNRQKNLGQIDAWAQSRNPYYSTLYESMNKAAEAPVEQQYADQLKRMQLQHVARGTQGSSQNIYNQGQINAAKAMEIAKARQQTQDYVQGIRRQDMDTAQQLRLQQFQMSPFEQEYYNKLQSAYGVKDRAYGAMADIQAQKLRDQMAYQQAMSQVYGQAIGMGMQGAQIYAMGV